MNALPLADEHVFPPFIGFPKEGLDFFRKLKKNNNREWFQKHKAEYEELAKFPMQCLIATLGRTLHDVAPEFDFNPKRSIFRIHRDVRFSKNKAPYKTNIAASFELRGMKGRTEMPGLYVGIEPGEVFVGGGLYMPGSDQLKAIRKSLAERPEKFLEIVRERRFKKEFGGIEGEKLQKAPFGYPKDHPMIDYLRHKQFYVGKVYDEKVVLKSSFAGRVAADLTYTLPFVRWLVRAVG